MYSDEGVYALDELRARSRIVAVKVWMRASIYRLSTVYNLAERGRQLLVRSISYFQSKRVFQEGTESSPEAQRVSPPILGMVSLWRCVTLP